MAARLDYRWHLRQVMAARGMFSTTDLLGPLAGRGIKLSVPAAGQDARKTKTAGGEGGVGDLRPKRARVALVRE